MVKFTRIPPAPRERTGWNSEVLQENSAVYHLLSSLIIDPDFPADERNSPTTSLWVSSIPVLSV